MFVQVFEALIDKATRLMQSEQNVVEVNPKHEETVRASLTSAFSNLTTTQSFSFALQVARHETPSTPLHDKDFRPWLQGSTPLTFNKSFRC